MADEHATRQPVGLGVVYLLYGAEAEAVFP